MDSPALHPVSILARAARVGTEEGTPVSRDPQKTPATQGARATYRPEFTTPVLHIHPHPTTISTTTAARPVRCSW